MYTRVEIEDIIIGKFDASEYGYTVVDIFKFLIQEQKIDITKSITQSIINKFLKKEKLFRVNYVITGTWVYYSILKKDDAYLSYYSQNNIITVQKQ